MKHTKTPVVPQGYRPDRYFVWIRWIRVHRKIYVSSKHKEPKPLIVT